VPQYEIVKLTIFDIMGRPVKNLVNETLGTGEHSVSWNGTNKNGNRLKSGIYYCRLMAGTHCETFKISLIK
jgi:flagellar hook assembly protein FlgD